MREGAVIAFTLLLKDFPRFYTVVGRVVVEIKGERAQVFILTKIWVLRCKIEVILLTRSLRRW